MNMSSLAQSVRVLRLANVVTYGEHHCGPGEIVVAHDPDKGEYYVMSWDGQEAHDMDDHPFDTEAEARKAAAAAIRQRAYLQTSEAQDRARERSQLYGGRY